MKIYDVVECNGAQYDERKTSILITEDKSLLIAHVENKLNDEDFVIGGFEESYHLDIYTWENGRCKFLFTCTPTNKMETFNFLESL